MTLDYFPEDALRRFEDYKMISFCSCPTTTIDRPRRMHDWIVVVKGNVFEVKWVSEIGVKGAGCEWWELN